MSHRSFDCLGEGGREYIPSHYKFETSRIKIRV